MLNIHLGDTVVTALAKCIFFLFNSRKAYHLSTYSVIRVSALAKVHFFGHFWQWANFFSDCFFLSERLRFRSPRIIKERALASDDVLICCISPSERSERRAFIKFSVYSLLKRVVLYLFIIRGERSEPYIFFVYFLLKKVIMFIIYY